MSAFSIESSSTSGSRGKTGLFQCTTPLTAFACPAFAGAATCGSGADDTHSPFRAARVMQLSTTPRLAAATSIGSAPGRLTQPRHTESTAPSRTARLSACSLTPRRRSVPTLAIPCVAVSARTTSIHR